MIYGFFTAAVVLVAALIVQYFWFEGHYAYYKWRMAYVEKKADEAGVDIWADYDESDAPPARFISRVVGITMEAQAAQEHIEQTEETK